MNKDETFELKFGLPTYDPARPSVLRNGEPCNHPGCASHISHPCEGCGRYAAGLRSGPDTQAVNNRLVELARTHATVHNVLMAARCGCAAKSGAWSSPWASSMATVFHGKA